jgi:hypothetical protein
VTHAITTLIMETYIILLKNEHVGKLIKGRGYSMPLFLLDDFTFCVWNQEVIPEDIALRIFQRNNSTKKESGRGMGT